MTARISPAPAASSRRSSRWKRKSVVRSSGNSPLRWRAVAGGLAFLLGAAVCGAAGSSVLPTDASVRRVVDGDTIELSDGRLVRYIGVDAPEVRRKSGGAWVLDPEPLGQEATAFNRQLVEGRRVRLEYDVQTHDRFGRLLAYVYVGETMANAALLEAGFAQPLTIPPDVRYAEQFRALAARAREAGRGLWGLRKAAR